jgi:hypothetical protein
VLSKPFTPDQLCNAVAGSAPSDGVAAVQAVSNAS